MLDHVPRRTIFGMGRGLARIEYEAFVSTGFKGRDRFVEDAQLIIDALETGVTEGGSLTGSRAARFAPSPSSRSRGPTRRGFLAVDADHGESWSWPLVIPQKPLDAVKADLRGFTAAYGRK